MPHSPQPTWRREASACRLPPRLSVKVRPHTRAPAGAPEPRRGPELQDSLQEGEAPEKRWEWVFRFVSFHSTCLEPPSSEGGPPVTLPDPGSAQNLSAESRRSSSHAQGRVLNQPPQQGTSMSLSSSKGQRGKSPGDEPSSEHGPLGMEPTGKLPAAHTAHIGQLWGHGRDEERCKPVKAELCKRAGGGGHCRDARSGLPAVLAPAHRHNVSS